MKKIVGIGNPEFAYKTLVKMGYDVIYIISKDLYNKKKFVVGNPLIVVDDYEEKNLRWILESICEKNDIAGIVNFEEDHQYIINKISSELSFEHASLEAIDISNNKYKTRQLLDKLNLKNVPFSLIKERSDIYEFIDKEGFPFILKGVSGTGSKDVYLIQGYDDLNSASLDLENKLVEKYIGGNECSVEYITKEGVASHILNKSIHETKEDITPMNPLYKKIELDTNKWIEKLHGEAYE